MIENDSNIVQKIKQNIFMATDVLSLDLTLEKLTPVSIDEQDFFDQCLEIFDEVELILTTGPTWEFNPTNRDFYLDITKDFTIDKQKLSDYVRKESTLEIVDLDINNNVTVVKIPVKMLIANVRTLSNEMIDKSSYHTVATLFGEIPL
jgi:hypothetical protein